MLGFDVNHNLTHVLMNLLVARGYGRLEFGAGRVFGSFDSGETGPDRLSSGAFMATIGFRYQPPVRRSLVFRAGLTPFYSPEHDDPVWIGFGVSLGQVF